MQAPCAGVGTSGNAVRILSDREPVQAGTPTPEFAVFGRIDIAMKERVRDLVLGTAGHIDHGKTALVRA